MAKIIMLYAIIGIDRKTFREAWLDRPYLTKSRAARALEWHNTISAYRVWHEAFMVTINYKARPGRHVLKTSGRHTYKW